MTTPLNNLDALIGNFRQALEAEDLDEQARINGEVRSCVEDATASLRAGEISADTLRERLTRLEALTAQATRGAEEARASAQAGLKDVSRNRSAARQYADIGGRGSS